MSAGNPEQIMEPSSGQFSALADSNYTQVTPTTCYENGWTPIREDEFERLPDWCINIYNDRMNGKINPTTNEELAEMLTKYFATQPTAVEHQTEVAESKVTTEINEVSEDMKDE